MLNCLKGGIKNKMATLKDGAKAYEPTKTKNIADLEAVSLDSIFEERTAKDKNDKEYSYSELEEIFTDEFLKRGIVFSGYIIKDYFPEFTKIRKTKNKIKETYYKFKIEL